MNRPSERARRRWQLAALACCLLALGGLPACGGDTATVVADTAPLAVDGPTGVRLRPVPGVPQIAAGPPDAHGHKAAVSCSTCHSMKPPAPERKSGSILTQFHQELRVQHGSLSCLACHNSEDYDSLKLASGERIPFERVMDLCAQCHGTQARDYEHGAHGGMSGHWDTTRGEQVRNQCTHCHDPHGPAFPRMQPTFKPRDRFLPVASPKQESNDE